MSNDVTIEKQGALVSVENFSELVGNYSPSEIIFHEESLRVQIEKINTMYANLLYTEDDHTALKKKLAELRKLDKEITKGVSIVRKEYMIPYDNFKKKADNLKEELSSSIKNLEKQNKEFEQQRKAKKRAEIEDLYAELVGNVPVPLKKIFKERWLNASTTKLSIKREIMAFLEDYKKDMKTLDCCNVKYYDQVLAVYLETLDISQALKENEKFLEQEKIIERHKKLKEQEKLEQQRKLEEQKKLEQPKKNVESGTETPFGTKKPIFSVNHSSSDSQKQTVASTKKKENQSSKLKVLFELEMEPGCVPIFLDFLKQNDIQFKKIEK